MPSNYHSSEVREAILALYLKDLPYSQIVKRKNAAGIGQISKGTVYFQVKKYHETNSVENRQKSGRPQTARTPKRNYAKLAFEAEIS